MAELRILVVSNFYPPQHIGGYELGCRDVVEALRRRGHGIHVLTSSFGLTAPRHEGAVRRALTNDFGVVNRGFARTLARTVAKEVRNQRAFRLACRELQPEIVYIWNAAHISVSLAQLARRLSVPVSFFVSDHWFAQWARSDVWHQLTHGGGSTLKAIVARSTARAFARSAGLECTSDDLDYTRVQFASSFLKKEAVDAGLPVELSQVIRWGIDLRRFPRAPRAGTPRKLLYVGQLVPHKGVHTAIEAFRMLIERHGSGAATLSIVGGTTRPNYEADLRRQVRVAGLSDDVRFVGHVPRETMPSIYASHDVLVFPSEWDEPFSITVLEAMAAGLVVVGTATGGSAEVMRDGVNALVFPPRESERCAAHLLQLTESPDLCEQLRSNARRTVEAGFDLGRMVDRIEAELLATSRADRAVSYWGDTLR